ncbi:MAG: porin, partial [Methylococcaceae bacterium]|nr:porin [Methylococcaceae bacterium]
SGTAGPTSDTNSKTWALYSIVGKHNLNDKTHLVMQHDHGFAEGAADGGAKTAEWYGINSYIFYDINDKLAAGLRAEYFRDQDGYRVANSGRCFAGANGSYNAAGNTCTTGAMAGGPGPNTYYALTAGLSYKPMKWLNLRPNMRLDYADKNAFGFGSDGLAVQKTQFLFSADAVVTF